MTPQPQTPHHRDTDTRDRLLEAGAELFAKKGFNGCGLSEILRHAGIPKGSFYHWFGSKEEFGVALIERTRDGYVDLLRPVLTDRKLPPLKRLRRVFEIGREQCEASGASVECLITRLALETSDLSETVHAAVKCAYQQWSAMLAQVIREALAAGEIDGSHDPDRLANVLVMLWEGASIRMQIERDLQPLDDFLDFVFDRMLGNC